MDNTNRDELTRLMKLAMKNTAEKEATKPLSLKEFERQRRERLKDIYISPEALEELRNWNAE